MILLSCSVFAHLSFLVAVKVCTFEFEHAAFYRKFQFVNCLRLSKRECMLSFKNVLKKSALKKIYLQCFTAFFSWRNDYYGANRIARSKNYILRTALETIILFFLFYSMYEIPWRVKSKWSPLLNRTVWMGFTQPAIPSMSIMGAFFTAVENATVSKETWNAFAILTELSMKSMKQC